MNPRQTDYEIGAALSIVDTFFHNYHLGEHVTIINKDKFSYLVKNAKNEWWWVDENQVTPLNKPVIFTTTTGLKGSYYYCEDGCVNVRLWVNVPKGYYYSCLNEVLSYFEEVIHPSITRKHPSQQLV